MQVYRNKILKDHPMSVYHYSMPPDIFLDFLVYLPIHQIRLFVFSIYLAVKEDFWMKKPLLPFILFGLVITAAGCKSAPADKAPEPTPVETAKAPVSDTQASQTENKSEMMQASAPIEAVPSNSEKTETTKIEQKTETKAKAPAASAAKTNAPKQSANATSQKATAKAPAQKVMPQKAAVQSANTSKNKNVSQAKNAPQAKNTQITPAKQEPVQQKTAKSKTPAQANQTAAVNSGSSKKPVKAAPQTAPATSAAKTDATKQPAKTTSQKAPAKEPAQKVTPQKTAAQSESASKSKNVPQAKNAQTKPAKQEATQQKTAKSPATAANTQKKSAPTEVTKKDAPKTVASAKQEATDKAPSAKQSENKTTDAKTKEPAAYAASAQITDISWMIEQADASFVSKQHKGNGKIFVTMLAKYKGDLTDQDFQEAFFASPVDVWSLNAVNAKGLIEINKKDKVLMLKHLSAGENEGAAALGKWFASITLVGQKPFEKELNVTGISGQTALLSADKTAQEKAKKTLIPLIVPIAKAENEQQALIFPVIHSVSRDADTIEIIFSIKDSRVKNAYFYFDVPGEEYYRDSGSMIDATGKPVNGCRSFSTDGKKCQYVLRKDATNKDWFGKATQCFLVVSDVNRVASPWEERHRTVSAASRITK